jgi:alkylation response protein AidB-like acyl-CoA dehydrogenase
MAVLTEEQSMLRDAARGWVQSKSPIGTFRKTRDSGNPAGFDADAWREQAGLGWAGVLIPEQFGGSDFGFFAMGLILEEMGRTLTASPLLASSLIAASAINLGGTDMQRQTWLPAIANGSLVATAAFDEASRHAPQDVKTIAMPNGSRYFLNGRKAFVIEGPSADMFVVSARLPGATDGIGLFLVRADTTGVSRQNVTLIDSRGVSNILFESADAELLGGAVQGAALLDAALDRARIGMSAEMLGMASSAFEITLDYLKTRVQFGQPIGAFQSLQHRAAAMFTELELARSAVEAALKAADENTPDLAELASLAKAKMGETLHLISNEMIQMHGGIGMTDEHDAGLFLKRARSCEAAFGNRAYHRDRYGRLLGY